MKRGNALSLGFLAFALLVFGWAVSNGPPPRKTDRRTERAEGEEAYRFVRCPECGFQTGYNPALADRPCPHCGEESAARLVPVRRPGGQERASLRKSALASAVVLAAGLLLAVHAILFLRTRARNRLAGEPNYYCRCPKCGRKIRYRASQAGRPTLCPGCREEWPLPFLPDG